MHRHRPDPTKTYERCYSGPVSPRQNPVAHGNICIVEECSCGAVRRTNSNAGAIERGPWVEADVAAEGGGA